MVKMFSIKEKYSTKIFNKEKKVELRRSNVKLNRNEICYIYTTSPIMKVTGYFIVEKTIRLPLDKLWKLTKNCAGVTKEEFFSYFEGLKEGTAIVFKKVHKFQNATALAEIKIYKKDFRPPQSYCNVDIKIVYQINKKAKVLNSKIINNIL
jgi:predicted transcriptional regulator